MTSKRLSGVGACVLALGLAIPAPAARDVAGPSVELELTKESAGTVRLTVRCVAPQALLQRYADRRLRLSFETLVAGRWRPLPPLRPGLIAEPVEDAPTDWARLGEGDAVSWTLTYNATGRLRRGDVVRLRWRPGRESLPATLRTIRPVFPSTAFVAKLTVG